MGRVIHARLHVRRPAPATWCNCCARTRAATVVGGMYDDITTALGGLDVFVANAGIWPERDVPLAEMPASRWTETLRANLEGVYFTTRGALQVLRPGGSIVMVSSTAGQRGEAFHADYAASKGAV